MTYKKEGFDGQKAIVLPKSIINKLCLTNTIINRAFITDIGYYPKARYHFRKRTQGAEQNILIYCIDGKGLVKIQSSSYTIGPGEYLVIPQGYPHSYETDEKNPWTIYWCHFKGEQADEFVKKIISKSGSYKYSIDFLTKRIELFDQLYMYLEQGYSYENITYSNILFLQFLSSFVFNEKFKSTIKAESDDILEKSISFMQENVGSQLTLKDLASHVNCSASHYCALFRKKNGTAPIEYFNHLKIQKACQYLQFTPLRVSEIAVKIGVADPFYFSRLFTKTMGISPKEYRERTTEVK
ncbi:MAG: AraC family transcriptional regulator [Mucilaginibacter sp.]